MVNQLYDELVKAEINTHEQLQIAAKNAKEYISDAVNRTLLRRLNITAILDLEFNVWTLRYWDKKKYFSQKTSMISNYATSYACATDNCKEKIKLFPDLIDIMPAVEDQELLAKFWLSWSSELKDANGNFLDFVALVKAHSVEKNYYTYWEKLYESGELANDVEKLWTDLLPLYEELHAYARRRLMKKYKNFNVSTIEIHLFRDLWSEDWSGLMNDLIPYKDTPSGDITQKLKEENISLRKLYHMVDDCFASIGLTKAPLSVWANSIFEKNIKKKSSCVPSVFNLFEDNSFAITTCGNATKSKVSEAFRHMGQLQYFKQCGEQQPVVFCRSVGTFFADAVGGVVELSAMNPSSLRSLHLINDDPSDERIGINYLMGVALQSLPRIAFYHSLNKWQKALYENLISEEFGDTLWPRLRNQDYGITPPKLSNGNAIFGPSHYLIYANEPAYPLLFAEFLRFDLFSSLCKAAKYDGPLHLCSIQGKSHIGAKLANLLSPGLSEPWTQLLQKFNGANKVRADSLLRFFEPLYKWLKRENDEENECYGWGYTPTTRLRQPRCDIFLPSQTENYVAKLMQAYDLNVTNSMQEMQMSWWSFAKGNKSLDTAMHSSLAAAENQQVWSEKLKKVYLPMLRNEILTRAVKKARFVEINLKTEDLAELLNKTAQLSNVGCVLENCFSEKANSSLTCSSYEKCNSLMANSTDVSLLNETWTNWHDRKHGPFDQLLEEAVALSNKGANNSGFSDTTEVWEKSYEMDNLEAKARKLWIEILPFYEQLHAFVRFNLQFIYVDQFNISALPAHILGSVTAASWTALFQKTAPCSDCPIVNREETLLRLNYTSSRIAEVADRFFQSLGMPPMTESFWKNSDFSPSYDLPESYTSVWDMFGKDDYRMLASSQVTWKNFLAIHKAMARIQYFMHYANQSIVFRQAPNLALYEAIEGFVALVVSSSDSLGTACLTKAKRVDSLNLLMMQALELLPQLALDHVTDLWKWKVFRSTVPRKKWNSEWWSLRHQYQGIVPPTPRGENSFDPPNELAWPLDLPSMHSFLGKIMQFQIFQHMCNLSGHVGALHLCNLRGNKRVGEKLAEMLRLGSSVHWSKALKMVASREAISVQPLLDYFKPLLEFLNETNNNKSNCYGWGFRWPLDVDQTLPKPRCDEHMDWPFDQVRKEELRLNDFLRTNEIKMQAAYQQAAKAEWRYVVSKTDLNEKLMMDAVAERIALENEQAEAANALKVTQICDPKKRRLLKRIAKRGLSLSTEDGELFISALRNMTLAYKATFVCAIDKPGCNESANRADRWYLKPDLDNILATSNDTELLEYVWTEWRRKVGQRVLPSFKELIRAFNSVANRSGYEDAGAWWQSFYEESNLNEMSEQLWKTILPFYEILHAHVRHSLLGQFLNDTKESTIPAHLLRNMWANDWSRILDVTETSAPQSFVVQATEQMIQQNYTMLQMAREADEFFKSIGLPRMDNFFWNNSIFGTQGLCRKECQSVAMDFYNGKDFAISHCGRVSLQDLATYHRLMAHVHYFIAYSNQPVKFREGANPAFHEAIAGAIGLSVTSIEHMKKLNLLDHEEGNESLSPSIDSHDMSQLELKYLYAKALEIVPSLPHAYVTDLYRWKIMNGTIEMNELNNAWWKLKKTYQGIAPPVAPSYENFDAGSEYSVVHNIPQIQRFFGQIMQFQIYQALCNQSGHVGPLHRCDIANSTKAGQTLYRALSLGSSIPWPDALRLITNSDRVSAKPMLDYFEPLINWLKAKVEQNDECYGWEIDWPNVADLPEPRCSDRRKNASGKGIYFDIF
ncbi:angiotensin converting enzyme [Trichuris trichiura]|uniref:Angiotensin-converting enzyme n=1 Tax=Trichuris trichiura TaxID=36087 RepID=A0A077YZS2_TRITR|nr:angiotensin converting enzyme [Trichuris trichiura]